MAGGALLSASQQRALGGWMAKHWVSEVVVIGGTVAAMIILSVGGFTLAPRGFVLLVVGLFVARHAAAISIWMGRRRLQLAKANMPAPQPGALVQEWWQERARLRYIRQQWAVACKAHGVLGFGKTAPVLRPAKTHWWDTPWYSTLEGDLQFLVSPGPMGVKGGVGKLIEVRHDIAETCDVPELRIRRTGIGHAVITFMWTDPLERRVDITELPMAPGRNAFAKDETGAAVSLDKYKSVFVAGTQGSGKTQALRTLIADWFRDGDYVDCYVIDPKDGVDLGWLKRLATVADSRVQIKAYATEVGTPASGKTAATGAFAVCDEVYGRMQDRLRKNGTIDMDDWSKAPISQHTATKEEPRIVVLVDELMHLNEILKNTGGKTSPVGLLISKGRAAAIQVVAATQDPTKETVGPTRDLYGQFVSLRTSSASMTGVVLGPNAANAPCHLIPEDQPGMGYYVDADTGRSLKFRVAYTSDEMMRDYIQYGQPIPGMITGKAEVQEPQFNYRFYTADRQPLRTGITNNFERRYGEYRANYEKELAAIQAGRLDPAKALHQWFPFHDPSQTVVIEAADRADAKRKESEFIATGVWRWNHQENMGSHLRRVPPPVEAAGPSRWRKQKMVLPPSQRSLPAMEPAPAQPVPADQLVLNEPTPRGNGPLSILLGVPGLDSQRPANVTPMRRRPEPKQDPKPSSTRTRRRVSA